MSFDIWNFFKQRGCLTLRESKDIFFVLKDERMFVHSFSRIKIPSIHKPVVHYGVSIRWYWKPAFFRSLSSLNFCKFDVIAQIWLDPLRGFWGRWLTFLKTFFQLINFLMLFGVFLASNSLHDIGGKKIKKYICYNTKNFEQSHWDKIFYRMYGLAVMLFISRWTTTTNIDKISATE